MPSLVEQFKDLALTYDAPSGGSLLVYTDMPGSTLALRRTIPIPSTTGRQTYPFAFDAAVFSYALIEGTLIKFRVTSTGVVRLFRGVLRHRRLGVYFDGSRGEIWETTELAF